ncbi:MAG: protein kinase domain-containing protein, partial [Acidimicrobiales bacterium]
MVPPVVPVPIAAGRVLGGRYRLVDKIARGGMAEVWEGHDEVLARPVAVKVLQPHLAEDGVFLERFRREAITAARLAHPGVVSTYDAGSDAGTAYIVMELVRGRTLRQLLAERGPMDPELAVRVAAQIADALAHAHRSGLVHRDIKPANVLLTDEEWGHLRAQVTDFGIAKASAGLEQDLTRTGVVLGTPKYLSPEQIQGREPDARADLYALGVVLYEMVVGKPPFVESTDMATALAHVHDEPVPMSRRRPGIPPALDRLSLALLAKDPADRVPSAVAVGRALAAISSDHSSGAAGVPRPSPTSSTTGVMASGPYAVPGRFNVPGQPPTPWQPRDG